MEVEDAFDTTDALWAARSMDSSRVRRLTCYMLNKCDLLSRAGYLLLLLVPSQAEDANLLQ